MCGACPADKIFLSEQSAKPAKRPEHIGPEQIAHVRIEPESFVIRRCASCLADFQTDIAAGGSTKVELMTALRILRAEGRDSYFADLDDDAIRWLAGELLRALSISKGKGGSETFL